MTTYLKDPVYITRMQECIDLQEKMNSVVNKDWKKASYPFFRAAWLEAAELIDHLGWKWWKKTDTDGEQAVLEVVDIFHFVLSDCILRNRTASLCVGAYDKATKTTLSNKDNEYQIRTIENFVETSLIGDHHGTGMHVADFFAIVVALDISLDELMRLYIAKNVLNIFRQDHGYKQGTYQKEFEPGKEDNVFLMEFVHELGASLTYNTLYAKLEEKYKEVTSK